MIWYGNAKVVYKIWKIYSTIWLFVYMYTVHLYYILYIVSIYICRNAIKEQIQFTSYATILNINGYGIGIEFE